MRAATLGQMEIELQRMSTIRIGIYGIADIIAWPDNIDGIIPPVSGIPAGKLNS
jgi:hypothetical protein